MPIHNHSAAMCRSRLTCKSRHVRREAKRPEHAEVGESASAHRQGSAACRALQQPLERRDPLQGCGRIRVRGHLRRRRRRCRLSRRDGRLHGAAHLKTRVAGVSIRNLQRGQYAWLALRSSISWPSALTRHAGPCTAGMQGVICCPKQRALASHPTCLSVAASVSSAISTVGADEVAFRCLARTVTSMTPIRCQMLREAECRTGRHKQALHGRIQRRRVTSKDASSRTLDNMAFRKQASPLCRHRKSSCLARLSHLISVRRGGRSVRVDDRHFCSAAVLASLAADTLISAPCLRPVRQGGHI